MGPPDDVRLVEITPDTVDAVGALVTHATQRRFVDSVLESFGHALFPEEVNDVAVVPWLRAIHADGELVGFVMVAERTEAHPEAYLWRLLIDRRHQGRGIGGKVLDLLVDRLRAEGHNSLLTSWSAEPDGPTGFYLSYGFVPTGNVVDDEIEARLDIAG